MPNYSYFYTVSNGRFTAAICFLFVIFIGLAVFVSLSSNDKVMDDIVTGVFLGTLFIFVFAGAAFYMLVLCMKLGWPTLFFDIDNDANLIRAHRGQNRQIFSIIVPPPPPPPTYAETVSGSGSAPTTSGNDQRNNIISATSGQILVPDRMQYAYPPSYEDAIKMRSSTISSN